MKRIFTFIALVVFALSISAQKDVTKFLGIPVDGSKEDMIRKIKAKGFRSVSFSDADVLEGEFNGTDVNIHIATNRDKVWRIMVCDVTPVDENAIRNRFNTLCRQFEKNSKYVCLEDYTISEDEDISYEMIFHNKRYDAVYYQCSSELMDTISYREPLLSKYTPEQLENPTEEILREITDKITENTERLMDVCSNKPVWFIISKFYGKYYITMYYDNQYNMADGEDL